MRINALAEIALYSAVTAGWASLTVGVRALVHGPAQSAVWPISIGLLLLSASGWALVGQIALRGLYVMHRRGRGAN